MPHIADPLSAAAASSPAMSWADFTINTVGFSFRNGQVHPGPQPLHQVSVGASRDELDYEDMVALSGMFRRWAKTRNGSGDRSGRRSWNGSETAAASSIYSTRRRSDLHPRLQGC